MNNSSSTLNTKRADWLRAARWGLMFHYIDKPASSNVSSHTTPDEWNRRVDGFDVEIFARRVKNSGAGYVIWTLGQNTGHFCAPNAVYDELLGQEQSRLSKRDLVAEIAAALAPDVKVIAYLPSHAPSNHPEAVRALRLLPSWDASAWGLEKFWADEESVDEILSDFQRNWERIVTQWGLIWGDSIAGWWIDGCYFAPKMYCNENEPNFASFAEALRVGNSSRILAFNSGTASPFERLAPQQDYTAGEVSNKLPVNDVWTKLESETNGMQTQLLSFLGEYWGRGEPRFPDTLTAGYTKYATEKGIAMTWDIPIAPDGALPEVFLRQLDGIE